MTSIACARHLPELRSALGSLQCKAPHVVTFTVDSGCVSIVSWHKAGIGSAGVLPIFCMLALLRHFMAFHICIVNAGLQGSGAARPVFEQLLEQCQGQGKLHSMHVRIIDSYMPLSNGCRRTGETVSAIRNVNSMITAMGFYYSHPCIELTNLYRYLVELYADWAGSAPSPKLAARPKRQARETYQKYCALRLVCQGRRHGDDDLATKLRML